jgi:hypothetical protein
MAKAINFSVCKDSTGNMRITVDLSKKGVLADSKKSMKLAFIEGAGYGNFMKLDDFDPAFKGMSMQFMVIKPLRNSANEEPEEDTPAKKSNNKTASAPAPKKRGRKPAVVETEDEELDNVAEEAPARKKRGSEAAKNTIKRRR